MRVAVAVALTLRQHRAVLAAAEILGLLRRALALLELQTLAAAVAVALVVGLMAAVAAQAAPVS